MERILQIVIRMFINQIMRNGMSFIVNKFTKNTPRNNQNTDSQNLEPKVRKQANFLKRLGRF